MIRRNCTQSKYGCGGRKATLLKKFLEFFFSPAKNHSLSKNDKWLVRIINYFSSLFNILFAYDWLWTITTNVITLCVSVIFKLLQLRILCDINQHRSRSAATSYIKRFR